jgi:Ca2+-binding RTX toxin-like protein
LLSGGAGSDHLSGGAGNDTVHGGDGNDWLLGGEGFNFVSGGRGDDAIDSSSGDTVEGGEGNDQLKGRGYFDTEYRFNLGDGQDSIDDRRYGSDTSGGAHDRIVFGAGVQLAQVRFERQGEHLVVRVGQTDRIDIYNYFGAWNWGVIEHFFFADGTQWNVEDVLRMIAGGSAQHDIIQAGDGPDDIYAGGGDDSVNGMAGDDRIFGEDGNDTLHGESGANLLDGGSGNDHLVSTGSDTVIGGHGNDLLDTNAYADTLYRFGRGDGQDVIRDRQSYDYSGGASDTLVFGAGIAPSEVSVRRSSDHQLVLQIGPADRIQIVNYFGEWNWGRIENIRFADGTQWDYAQVTRLMVRGTDGNDAIVGAEGVDVVHGGLGSDHISGLDANDSLYGQAGDDTLVGGAGVNWLEGGDGNDAVESDGHGDTLVGGAGADSLIARGGPTIFLGGAGDGDWMESRYSADDEYRFSLGDGQDAMRDGSWLATSGGYDKAVFGPGISYEMLRFERSDWELRIRVSETDRLTVLNYFADAGHIEEIRFATDADMVLRGADVQEALANGGAIPVGLTLSGSGVLTGGSARDVLTATGYGTVLNGYAGADKLGAVANGSVFDLTFSGGAGNDTISGSYGRDVYKFNAGDGHDVVTDDVRSLGGGAADFFFEHPDTPTYQDQLDLGPGITPSSVSRTRVGNDLVLQFGGSADSVTVRNWFDGTTFNRIERITFANGTVWTAADADAGLGVGMNTAGAGTMTGSPYADTLVASAYGAQIAGSLGDDTLGVVQDGAIFDVTFKGGRGNDVINGSYARDFYRFNLGDGQDVITDDVRSLGQGVADYFTANPLTETYQDWLLFGEGVDPAAVSRARSGADLVLSIGSGADAIRVKNWFDGTLLSKIEGISFASGTVWSWSELEGNLADPVQRSAGGTLNGSGTSDTLTATAGGAIVLGYAGNDFLSAVANGAVFDVTFVGGRGNDSIIGSYARDHYRYELGDGHDKIRDDVRRLSQDVADYFAANPTAETYQDRLSFGAGIDPTGVTRLRDGNDLVLTVNAHDSVTIQDWFDGTIFNKIELIGFANGTVWAADSITG